MVNSAMAASTWLELLQQDLQAEQINARPCIKRATLAHVLVGALEVSDAGLCHSQMKVVSVVPVLPASASFFSAHST